MRTLELLPSRARKAGERGEAFRLDDSERDVTTRVSVAAVSGLPAPYIIRMDESDDGENWKAVWLVNSSRPDVFNIRYSPARYIRAGVYFAAGGRVTCRVVATAQQIGEGVKGIGQVRGES